MSGVLALLGLIALIIGGITLIIAAFKEHIAWGLAVWFLPFASLAFCIAHWDKARVGFLFQLGGVVAFVIGGGFESIGA